MSDQVKTNNMAQSAPQTNQVMNVTGKKPIAIKNELQGKIETSFNAATIKPIAWKPIMAGEKIEKYSLSGTIRMLTPFVPNMDALSLSIECYFVPHSRVWANAEKFTAAAARNGIDIKSNVQIPMTNPVIGYNDRGSGQSPRYIPKTDTTTWRDCPTSTYYPRLGSGFRPTVSGTFAWTKTKCSVLPLRAFFALYNDIWRHKELDTELIEYKVDTVSTAERQRYFPDTSLNNFRFCPRSRKKNNYYTNYRIAKEAPMVASGGGQMEIAQVSLTTHAEWQKRVAEARAEAINAQKTDWEIIAELRGSQVALEGKCQKIGHTEVGINFQQIASTTYGTDATIAPSQQALGQTGAYSYTTFNVDCCAYQQFKEEGTLHIVARANFNTFYMNGMSIFLTKENIDDFYRPELCELKDDTLKLHEMSTTYADGTPSDPVEDIGWKRKYSEYFKLPDCVNGDLTSGGWYDTHNNNAPILSKDYWTGGENTVKAPDPALNLLLKQRHLDYSDLIVNRNLAVKQPITNANTDAYNGNAIVSGENQFFMDAIATCITTMPIDERIKTDFKNVGEQ